MAGAGVAGLGSALTLSRQGHQVTIVERDATPTPHDPDEAFLWDRRGAPQVRHSHAFLARLRNLLRDGYPDVLDALLAAGATEIRFCDMLPETLVDRSAHPGDEDLVALACRRTTFEWVLRRIVLGDPAVELLDGVAVSGLETEGETVTGVGLADGRTLAGDLVVMAGGRRMPLSIDVPEREEDTGIVYYSRFYRLRDGAEPPEQSGPIAADLGYLKFAVFQGDNRTFSVTFAASTADDDLRRRLLDPVAFDAAARALATTAAWVEDGRSEPMTDVHVMARLVNRRRSFLDDEGRPRVLGLHAVGDAHTCTNPLYGRGCSLALVQADLLAEAVAAHPDDPVARSVAYEEASAREVDPWYRAAVLQDREAREQAAATLEEPSGSATTEDEDTVDPKAFLRGLLREGLLPALRVDAVVFRAFLRMFNLLTPPDALISDPEVINRVLAVYQERGSRPPEEPLGPERDELLRQLVA